MPHKDDLVKTVGVGKVYDNPEILNTYSRDFSFADSHKPVLLVKPKTANDVHEIVKWANLNHTTLVPISSGPPHFYGDTTPSRDGAVIVDLSNMKRILRIDRRHRMTVVEPGVTYGQLQPELAKNGLRLSTPLLPRANKSVIASLLERQPTIVPKYQWTLPEPLRCLEVVWGNGYKFLTGEAGEQISFSLEDQWKLGLAQMSPQGPSQVDYHRLVSAAQGTMGIVTWGSIKCEILPQIHKLFFLPANSLEDLIDCSYQLLRVRLGDEFLFLNNLTLATILGAEDSQIKALVEQLPKWVVLIGIAGRDMLPAERVAFQQKDIEAIALRCGIKPMSSIPGANDQKVLEAILNPSPEPYYKLRKKGGCQDIFFLTTLNRTPEFIKKMYSMAQAANYPVSDIGIYLQPQQQGTSCHCEFSLPYRPDDQTEVARVRELFAQSSEELIRHGAFFSRPYGIWANMVYSRDTQTTDTLRKIKGIFDPNNILNSGKLCF